MRATGPQLRHRPRETLARRQHHTEQPRRPLPTPPPAQATPPLGPRATSRRFRHLDLAPGQETHHPARPHGLATSASGPTTGCDAAQEASTPRRRTASLLIQADSRGGTQVGLPTPEPVASPRRRATTT